MMIDRHFCNPPMDGIAVVLLVLAQEQYQKSSIHWKKDTEACKNAHIIQKYKIRSPDTFPQGKYSDRHGIDYIPGINGVYNRIV